MTIRRLAAEGAKFIWNEVLFPIAVALLQIFGEGRERTGDGWVVAAFDYDQPGLGAEVFVLFPVCFLASLVAVEDIFAVAAALKVCGSRVALCTSRLRHCDGIGLRVMKCGNSGMNRTYIVVYCAAFTMVHRRRSH